MVTRAEEVLAILEKGEAGGAAARLADDLPLFSAKSARPRTSASPSGPSPIETALTAVTPDALSPREALETLYRLKALLPADATPKS